MRVLLLLALALPALCLYEEGTAVQLLNAAQFEEQVMNGDQMWLVEFYAPWCGHCKQLAPVYEKVAANLKGMVNVAAVDCDAEPTVAQMMGVKGFPTIKLIPADATYNPYTKKNSKIPEDYNGDRSSPKGFVKFALKHLPSRVALVNSTNVNDFLADEYPKVLLFSIKPTVSDLYKSLSMQYRDRLRFGQASDSEKALVKEFGATKFPFLVTIPGEDRSKFVVHDGEIKREELVAFMDKHALAKKTPDPSAPGTKKLVVNLEASDFDEKVMKDDAVWLVLFDKGPKPLPVLNELALTYDPTIKVGRVDAEKYAKLAKDQVVEEFPTLRLYQAEKSDTEDYSGKMEMGPMNEFVNFNIDAPVQSVQVGDALNTFMSKCVSAPCMVLLSNKQEVPTDFKLLALQYQKSLTHGMIAQPPPALLQQFQITAKLPRVMAFFSSNGTAESLQGIQHTGPMNLAALVQFASNFVAKKPSAPAAAEAQPLVEVSKDMSLNDACKGATAGNLARDFDNTFEPSSGGLCTIAILDGSNPDKLKEDLAVLDEVRKKKAGSPFKFVWVDGVCQPGVAAAFDISSDVMPTMLVVSLSKMRNRQLIGTFDVPTISGFLDNVLSGKLATSPFSQVPEVDSSADCAALHEQLIKERSAPADAGAEDDDIMAEVIAAAKAREAEERKLRKGDEDEDEDEEEPKKKKKKSKKKKKKSKK